MEKSFLKLQTEIGKWSCKTFPKSTQASVIAHIKDEVEKELIEDCDPEELADVAILLFGLAHRRGINLLDEIMAKFQKNKKRKWGPVNDKGFSTVPIKSKEI